MRNQYLLIFILLLLLKSPIHIYGQSDQSVNLTINNIMDNLRLEKNLQSNTDLLYKPENASKVLSHLNNYFSDTLYTVRAEAYSIASLVGQKSEDKQIRKKVINILLQGCADKSSSVCSITSQGLQSFKRDDFNAEATIKLGSLLDSENFYLDQIVKVAGFVGEKQYEAKLNTLLSNPKLNPKNKLAIQLALARMGNKEMQEKVLVKIKKQQLNDDVLLEVGPALAYIRQKSGINYLFEIILSDDKLCETSHPDYNNSIPCAYRALEYVAPIIKSFPIKLSESGDLEVKDYKASLLSARKWIKNNQHNYELIKDTF